MPLARTWGVDDKLKSSITGADAPPEMVVSATEGPEFGSVMGVMLVYWLYSRSKTTATAITVIAAPAAYAGAALPLFLLLVFFLFAVQSHLI